MRISERFKDSLADLRWHVRFTLAHEDITLLHLPGCQPELNFESSLRSESIDPRDPVLCRVLKVHNCSSSGTHKQFRDRACLALHLCNLPRIGYPLDESLSCPASSFHLLLCLPLPKPTVSTSVAQQVREPDLSVVETDLETDLECGRLEGIA